MEIRHLEYFIEVARHKSFSIAAEVTHTSQPSISKAIKDLEAELGKTLFYRSTKYVKLTDAGELVLDQAQQIVAAFRNINTQLEGLAKLQTGKIHIGLPPITAVTTFSHMLGAFKSEYPKIQIQLFEYGPKKIEASLQDGLLDFGIFTPEDSDLFEWIWFEQDPLSVVMHSTHPLARYDLIDYKDFEGEQLILYNNDYKLHDIIIAGCKNAGITPEIAFETSQRELMTQMVTAKLGVALLPTKICQTLNPLTITYRPFADTNLCLQLALTWKKGRYLPHAAHELLAFLKTNYHLIESY
ncbi:transcriptional regulator [Desulfitobacterium dichloroeliminans LMG P-21439]|uniref:Transcriptional regulator n=1 Tax=Desulfitobacterium dichloroeliminans (strain LMG P-21439 / DCA1) TaxID=871963 RepID=L0F4T2_DESDL|nr:LysR family transcriptional regulator [Desulfitobacterium dichloroeliminans]AGA68192.1 transcriptional regulator [Desulfitobacterium dichloroeliminans LMG P-21439]